MSNERCLSDLLNELIVVADQADRIPNFKIRQKLYLQFIVVIHNFLRWSMAFYSFRNKHQSYSRINLCCIEWSRAYEGL